MREELNSKYETYNVNQDNQEALTMESEMLNSSLDNENMDLIDEEITTIIQISAGETKVFSHRNIHLKSSVNCAGELIFDHCIINYNEADIGDEIALNRNASLSIKNCDVRCKGPSRDFFITCEGPGRITIDSSSFEDCTFFISAASGCEFTMTNCRLHNCYKGFLELFESNSVIKDNIIIQDGLMGSYFKGDYYDKKRMISISGYNNSTTEFSNNIIIEEEGFREAIAVDKKKKVVSHSDWSCYESNRGEVRNCTFNGISNPVIAPGFIECRFENCTAGIKMSKHASCAKNPYVEGCLFSNSTNVICTIEGSRISNCQFVSCYNNIISPASTCDFGGGVIVEFCQFLNTENRKVENRLLSEYLDAGYPLGVLGSGLSNVFCLTFSRGNDSKSKASYLKKCIFDGVVLEDNFLIGVVGTRKPSGTVVHIEDCDFRNIGIGGNTETIISKNMKYNTLFKSKDFSAVNVSKCRGLYPYTVSDTSSI